MKRTNADPDRLTPHQASSFYALELLSSSRLPELATSWLADGLDSPALRVLAGERDAPMSDLAPLFESALEELGVPFPERYEATLQVLRFWLERIVDESIDPMAGMQRIDRDLGDAARELFPDRVYLGEGLGIERLYTWYRELEDAADGSELSYYRDLPRHGAEARFRRHLVDEARAALVRFGLDRAGRPTATQPSW
jgi:hypothetical protein